MATNELTYKLYVDGSQALREIRKVRRSLWSVTVLRDWPFYGGFTLGVVACAVVALAVMAVA